MKVILKMCSLSPWNIWGKRNKCIVWLIYIILRYCFMQYKIILFFNICTFFIIFKISWKWNSSCWEILNRRKFIFVRLHSYILKWKICKKLFHKISHNFQNIFNLQIFIYLEKDFRPYFFPPFSIREWRWKAYQRLHFEEM